MSAGIKWPEAMPLRFDLTTGNLYNAENIALARFRHMSQGEAVANACNAAPALVSALEKCIRDFENMDENQPADAGCIDCTAGTVPNHLNTGRCGYHEAKVALRLARGEDV